MISSIRLMNWRSHADSTLQFKKGTNLLVGAMGSGKSSVLDAIAFALFGTFPVLERRRLKLIDMIRARENAAEVALEFESNGSRYKVIRKINRKKDGSTNSEAKLFVNGKLVDEGSEAITEQLENAIGVNYDLFTRAIYSEQNNIDYFLSIDPRKRKEEIDRLLGLDRFETARSSATTLIGRVRDNRKSLEQRFNKAQLDELLLKKSEFDKKSTAIRTMLGELEKKIVGQSTTVEQKSKMLTELQKKKEQYQTLLGQSMKLRGVIERLEKEIAGKAVNEKDVDKLRNDHEGLNKERTDLLLKANGINETHAILSSKLGSADTKKKMMILRKEEISKCEQRLASALGGKNSEQAKEELLTYEKKVLESWSKAKMLESKIAETQELTEKIAADFSECPVCGSQMSAEHLSELRKEKHSKLAEMKKEIERCKENARTSEKRVTQLKTALREIDSTTDRLQVLKKEYIDPASFDQEMTGIIKQVNELQVQRVQLQGALEGKNKQYQEMLLKIREYEQILKKIIELKKANEELTTVAKAISENAFDDKTLDVLRSEYETVRIDYERANAEKKANMEQLRSCIDMLSVIEKDIAAQKELEKSILQLLETEEELTTYKNAIFETQLALRNDMIEGINAAIGEIWQIFYPHKNYAELKLVVTEKDYELQVLDDEWRGLETRASGGERACAALALRVALAMVLTPNLSWLILDEPTHNLDKDAVDLLSHTLQYKVPEVVEQTFVITHDEALAGSEFASSYKLSRDKTANGATIIEEL